MLELNIWYYLALRKMMPFSIRYLIRLKRDITYHNSHSYAKIKIDSDDNLPLEKTLTIHNVVILFILS